MNITSQIVAFLAFLMVCGSPAYAAKNDDTTEPVHEALNDDAVKQPIVTERLTTPANLSEEEAVRMNLRDLFGQKQTALTLELVRKLEPYVNDERFEVEAEFVELARRTRSGTVVGEITRVLTGMPKLQQSTVDYLVGRAFPPKSTHFDFQNALAMEALIRHFRGDKEFIQNAVDASSDKRNFGRYSKLLKGALVFKIEVPEQRDVYFKFLESVWRETNQAVIYRCFYILFERFSWTLFDYMRDFPDLRAQILFTFTRALVSREYTFLPKIWVSLSADVNLPLSDNELSLLSAIIELRPNDLRRLRSALPYVLHPQLIERVTPTFEATTDEKKKALLREIIHFAQTYRTLEGDEKRRLDAIELAISEGRKINRRKTPTASTSKKIPTLQTAQDEKQTLQALRQIEKTGKGASYKELLAFMTSDNSTIALLAVKIIVDQNLFPEDGIKELLAAIRNKKNEVLALNSFILLNRVRPFHPITQILTVELLIDPRPEIAAKAAYYVQRQNIAKAFEVNSPEWPAYVRAMNSVFESMAREGSALCILRLKDAIGAHFDLSGVSTEAVTKILGENLSVNIYALRAVTRRFLGDGHNTSNGSVCKNTWNSEAEAPKAKGF